MMHKSGWTLRVAHFSFCSSVVGKVVELRDDLVSQLGIQQALGGGTGCCHSNVESWSCLAQQCRRLFQVNQLFSFAHGAGENGQNGSSAVSEAWRKEKYHFLEVRTESKAVWNAEIFGYFDVFGGNFKSWQMKML